MTKDNHIIEIDSIAYKHSIPNDYLILNYLKVKTKRAEEDSKSRKSLGNNYCIYVLAKNYLSKKNKLTPSELLGQMRALPFGSKLQNHIYDSRLDSEFKNITGSEKDILIKIKNNNKKYISFNEEVLTSSNVTKTNAINFLYEVLDQFINKIKDKDELFIQKITSINSNDNLIKIFEECININSDSRLFEVFSYVLLKIYYSKIRVKYETLNEKYDGFFILYKTGRTNANDGGIDFVLKPSGKFFQVTETLDFKKYFLDFEKTLRTPFSFVIKTDLSKKEVIKKIKTDAIRNKTISLEKINIYINLFEDIYTNIDLKDIFNKTIKNDSNIYQKFKSDLLLNFKIEYGFYD